MEHEHLNTHNLRDIRDIKINQDLPKEERIIDFIRQIDNPYLFKCGDITVECVFSEDDVSLDDRLKQYLRITRL